MYFFSPEAGGLSRTDYHRNRKSGRDCERQRARDRQTDLQSGDRDKQSIRAGQTDINRERERERERERKDRRLER